MPVFRVSQQIRRTCSCGQCHVSAPRMSRERFFEEVAAGFEALGLTHPVRRLFGGSVAAPRSLRSAITGKTEAPATPITSASATVAPAPRLHDRLTKSGKW